MNCERPVIVEGAVILDVLEQIGFQPNWVVHVINEAAPESSGELGHQISDYEERRKPKDKSNTIVELKPED